jgi:UDP-N-acetylmuramoylalanine--D-glutamate ligase
MATQRVMVYGLGVSGVATASRLRAEGVDVVAVDDDDSDAPRARAARLGIELVAAPAAEVLEALARAVDEIVVSPGVPASHVVFSRAGDTPVVSEVELAWRRARCPIVAVTGTNGKTTVTTLVQAMLASSGRRAVAAGNIGRPLLDVVDGDAEVVVAEVSSFQLALTTSFRPSVGAWLNFGPDHLDWHPTEHDYRAAKARLWANSGPGDVAVANAEDPVVREESDVARRRGADVRTFGLRGGDFRVHGGELVGPAGALAAVEDLPRRLPHDVTNALCASAAALAAGASVDGCRAALVAFRGLPHRVELVGEAYGVRFYDDSKATTPGAVLAAVGGFDSVVLIAGGRNKGLDLSILGQAAPRLRAAVAIGEAAGELADSLGSAVPVVRAASMADAVHAAFARAQRSDVVLLSPACASFDWYGSYAERGDDFARCVRALRGYVPPSAASGDASGGMPGGDAADPAKPPARRRASAS